MRIIKLLYVLIESFRKVICSEIFKSKESGWKAGIDRDASFVYGELVFSDLNE